MLLTDVQPGSSATVPPSLVRRSQLSNCIGRQRAEQRSPAASARPCYLRLPSDMVHCHCVHVRPCAFICVASHVPMSPCLSLPSQSHPIGDFVRSRDAGSWSIRPNSPRHAFLFAARDRTFLTARKISGRWNDGISGVREGARRRSPRRGQSEPPRLLVAAALVLQTPQAMESCRTANGGDQCHFAAAPTRVRDCRKTKMHSEAGHRRSSPQ